MTAPLLTFVLLLLTSSAAVACASAHPKADLKPIRVYMHENLSGSNATLLTSVQFPLGGSATFGQTGVLDNELRDGLHRGSSSPLGRFQGLFAITGLANMPGLLSAVNVVFTGGKYHGSTLAMLGTIQYLRATIESTVVSGTGAFRMARGYSSMVYIPEASTVNNDVYMIDFFVDA